MRAIAVGLVLALAAGGFAQADEASDSAKAWQSPGFAGIRDKWPKQANGDPVVGNVALDCAAGPDGAATNCHVKSPDPKNAELERAALAVAPLFKARSDAAARTPLVVGVSKVVAPDWLRKPTFDQMMAVFPAKASGMGGQAVIKCIVKTDGLLRACAVKSEKPEGRGFGGAALALAPTFLMKPKLRDGQPIEGEVTIPINFGDSGSVFSGPTVTVATTPVWDKTPTIPEILAELDKKVGDRFADGKVVFQCTVSKKTGHLSDCITINSSPGMAGFTPAARALTSKFEVDKEYLASAKNELRVNLAFSFPDMQSETWSKRYQLHPVWLKTVSPDPNQPLFPEDAAKAGFKTGSATVDCVLAASGALTNCSIVSESNPGVGFGELAKKIAEVFVANPWTEDGLPADGAHVRMPIMMNYEPPAEASPAPTPSTKP